MSDLNLRILLNDWEDPDVTQYYLACCLGLLPYNDDFESFRTNKHIFWTDNTTSRCLNKMLQTMRESGLLEFDEKESKFRWSTSN